MKKILFLFILIFAMSGCSDTKKETKDSNKAPVNEETKENSESSIDNLISDKNKSQKTMIIFDASGSMWGLIDGTKKLDIAKTALKDITKSLNNDKVGLMAYGHRTNGDCKDIEILAEPKKNNSDNISKILDKISPKGRTPIGGAISKAADFLNYKEVASNVILLSDGDESCDVNLCEFAKKIKSESKDFTINVIALDMEKSKTIGLKCLADETHGKFMIAKNLKDLEDALNKATGSKKSSSLQNNEEADNKLVKLKLLGKNSIKNKMTISWTAPNNENDLFAVVPKGSFDFKDNIFTLYELGQKGGISKITIPTKKGSYDIVYWHDKKRILARKNFEVEKTIADISTKDTVDIGEKFSITWIGPNNSDDVIAIVPSGLSSYEDNLDIVPYLDKKTGVTDITAPFEAGDYDIIYLLNQKHVIARKNLHVNNVIVKFDEVEERLKTDEMVNFTWIGPNRDTDIIAIIPYSLYDSEKLSDSIFSLNAKNGTGTFKMPSEHGYYSLTYWLNGEKNIKTESIYVYER